MKNSSLIILLIALSWIGVFLIGYDVGSEDIDITIEVDEDMLDLACTFHEIDETIYHRAEYTKTDSSYSKESGHYYFYAGQKKVPNPNDLEEEDLFTYAFGQWYVKSIAK